jgi:Endonuclease NucS
LASCSLAVANFSENARVPTETQIGDYLAANIEALEPGLCVIEREFKLPNPLGAKGFVDILAKDRFGHMVVIELKRSDQAARVALHELHKYVALLKSSHGIESHQLRCMVCSTEWHELRVPFSEYARTVAYSVEGRQIELGPDGIPVTFRPVTLCAEPHGLRLCPRHMILFYKPEDGLERLAEAATLVAQNF